jgi:hypothetical protein
MQVSVASMYMRYKSRTYKKTSSGIEQHETDDALDGASIECDGCYAEQEEPNRYFNDANGNQVYGLRDEVQFERCLEVLWWYLVDVSPSSVMHLRDDNASSYYALYSSARYVNMVQFRITSVVANDMQ